MKQIEECMTIHKLLQNSPFKVELEQNMLGQYSIGSRNTDINFGINPKLDNRDIIINFIKCLAFCYLFKKSIDLLNITYEQEEALELLSSNVKTNHGEMPLVDYFDYIVQPTGYDDYVEYLKAGYSFKGYKEITHKTVMLKEDIDNIFDFLVLDERESEYITYLVLKELDYSTEYYLSRYPEVQRYGYKEAPMIANKILALL